MSATGFSRIRANGARRVSTAIDALFVELEGMRCAWLRRAGPGLGDGWDESYGIVTGGEA